MGNEEQENIKKMGKLEIGDHDSLLLFGSDIQQELGETSKKLASIAMDHNGEVESLIQKIIAELDDFQTQLDLNQNKIFSWLKKGKKENCVKRYSQILIYIDKAELLLKLQEIQLIKDIKLLGNLQEITTEIEQDLEKSILYAESILKSSQSREGESEEVREWYVRLTRKIENFKIGHTLAIQSKAQIAFLLQNDRELIDKIVYAVSETIPLWRNQVSLLLGLQKIKQEQIIQKKISQPLYEVGMKNSNIDVNELLKANEGLRNVLDELLKIENDHLNVKKEM